MKSSTRNSFKGTSGIKRLVNALMYSKDGYISAWSDEEAFRQIILINLLAIPSALYFGNTFSEKILLLIPAILCIVVELINSAVENVVDRISLDFHDLSKKAKDMGSAAQLTTQLLLFGTWLIFFIC